MHNFDQQRTNIFIQRPRNVLSKQIIIFGMKNKTGIKTFFSDRVKGNHVIFSFYFFFFKYPDFKIIISVLTSQSPTTWGLFVIISDLLHGMLLKYSFMSGKYKTPFFSTYFDLNEVLPH